MKIQKILTGLALIAFASSATAVPISGSALQSGLDAITQDGSFQDVNTSQIQGDDAWVIDASGASINTLIFEFAGFAGSTTFGIYDILDPSKKLEIFSGPDGSGTIDVVLNAGTATFTNIGLNGGANGGSVTFGSTVFGYYLDSSASAGGGLFYSQKALNSDGVEHLVTFAGDGSDSLDIFGTNNYSPFAAGEYILAWEDLLGGGDTDYSDMVVLVESVTPVPEPSALVLLGLGLLGFAGARRKLS